MWYIIWFVTHICNHIYIYICTSDVYIYIYTYIYIYICVWSVHECSGAESTWQDTSTRTRRLRLRACADLFFRDLAASIVSWLLDDVVFYVVGWFLLLCLYFVNYVFGLFYVLLFCDCSMILIARISRIARPSGVRQVPTQPVTWKPGAMLYVTWMCVYIHVYIV